MRIWILGSGSAGNSLLIESNETKILVDAGFAPSVIRKRLGSIGFAPESIQKVVVTHEHSDHVRGAAACARKWGWTIVATGGTRMMCSDWTDVTVEIVECGARCGIGDLEIETIPVPHDATEPIGMVVTSATSGVRAGIVYDLGHVTETIAASLDRLDVLILESNHDEHMLRAGPYPFGVQSRIAGSHGHLSNREAARTASRCVHPGLGNIVLAHLSEKCNEPKVALTTVGDAVRKTRFRGRLTAAQQSGVAGPFGRGSSGRQPHLPAEQLALAI